MKPGESIEGNSGWGLAVESSSQMMIREFKIRNEIHSPHALSKSCPALRRESSPESSGTFALPHPFHMPASHQEPILDHDSTRRSYLELGGLPILYTHNIQRSPTRYPPVHNCDHQFQSGRGSGRQETGKTLVRENPPRFVAIGVRRFGCCCSRDMQGCSGAFADKELLFLERQKSKRQVNFSRGGILVK